MGFLQAPSTSISESNHPTDSTPVCNDHECHDDLNQRNESAPKANPTAIPTEVLTATCGRNFLGQKTSQEQYAYRYTDNVIQESTQPLRRVRTSVVTNIPEGRDSATKHDNRGLQRKDRHGSYERREDDRQTTNGRDSNDDNVHTIMRRNNGCKAEHDNHERPSAFLHGYSVESGNDDTQQDLNAVSPKPNQTNVSSNWSLAQVKKWLAQQTDDAHDAQGLSRSSVTGSDSYFSNTLASRTCRSKQYDGTGVYEVEENNNHKWAQDAFDTLSQSQFNFEEGPGELLDGLSTRKWSPMHATAPGRHDSMDDGVSTVSNASLVTVLRVDNRGVDWDLNERNEVVWLRTNGASISKANPTSENNEPSQSELPTPLENQLVVTDGQSTEAPQRFRIRRPPSQSLNSLPKDTPNDNSILSPLPKCEFKKSRYRKNRSQVCFSQQSNSKTRYTSTANRSSTSIAPPRFKLKRFGNHQTRAVSHSSVQLKGEVQNTAYPVTPPMQHSTRKSARSQGTIRLPHDVAKDSDTSDTRTAMPPTLKLRICERPQ